METTITHEENDKNMKAHVRAVHAAQKEEHLKAHQIHELVFRKGKGYEPVPIPQYERGV